MKSPSGLAEVFLAHAPRGTAVPERSRLDSLLAEAFDAARAPWPDLALPAERFIQHLAERLPASRAQAGVEQALRGLHLGDLYLACACVAGVPEATAALDRGYLAKVPEVLRRRRCPPDTIDDLFQKLRERLLFGRHLATYSGEGKLWSWIEVVAKRMANKAMPAAASDVEDWYQVADMLPSAGDLEKDVLKRDLLGELQSAVRAAAATLSGEERELLRFHYRDGLSEARLAKLYHSSQPTISRRLKRAREAILAETERLLRARLQLTSEDFASLVAAVQSRWLDLSLSGLLGEPGPEAG